jgi:hypothetical protein
MSCDRKGAALAFGPNGATVNSQGRKRLDTAANTRSPNGATDVIADPCKLLSMYDRGMITDHELASRVVAATTECPTAEFMVQLPGEVLALIRSQATAPADTEWITVGSCCASDIEAWERAKREQQKRWLAGLSWWREYFGFAG